MAVAVRLPCGSGSLPRALSEHGREPWAGSPWITAALKGRGSCPGLRHLPVVSAATFSFLGEPRRETSHDLELPSDAR